MFDRAACGEARPTASPYVSAAALSALRDLLRRTLKDTSASSSAPLSGVSRTSRDQNRREAHACQENGTPDETGGQSARPSAAARPVRRRSPQDNSGYASMAGPAGGDPGNADRSDGAADNRGRAARGASLHMLMAQPALMRRSKRGSSQSSMGASSTLAR